MNLDIAATGLAPPRLTTTHAAGPQGGFSADVEPKSVNASEASVTDDTIPASPPPEVMDAIATAMGAADRLAASGREMSFHPDPPTGKVTVAVHDLQGNLISTVSPSKVLDVADGGSVD
jgi:hypothetical protein